MNYQIINAVHIRCRYLIDPGNRSITKGEVLNRSQIAYTFYMFIIIILTYNIIEFLLYILFIMLYSIIFKTYKNVAKSI